MAVKERMDWYSFAERVAAGIITGIVTGLVLYYTYPAVVGYMERVKAEEKEAFISQHYYPEITVEEVEQ